MGKALLLAALAAGAACLPGCLLVAGTGFGAGIVHPTDGDAVEVAVEVPPAAAFAAAREELRGRGVLRSADSGAGFVEGTVGTSFVKVSVSGPASGLATLSVIARKDSGASPDPDTAEQIAVAIVKRTR
jgi:hypothetical protein